MPVRKEDGRLKIYFLDSGRHIILCLSDYIYERNQYEKSNSFFIS